MTGRMTHHAIAAMFILAASLFCTAEEIGAAPMSTTVSEQDEAGATALIDDTGNTFTCGYHDADLTVFSPEGEMLVRMPDLFGEKINVNSLALKGDGIIALNYEQHSEYLDTTSFDVVVDLSEVMEQLDNGTWKYTFPSQYMENYFQMAKVLVFFFPGNGSIDLTSGQLDYDDFWMMMSCYMRPEKDAELRETISTGDRSYWLVSREDFLEAVSQMFPSYSEEVLQWPSIYGFVDDLSGKVALTVGDMGITVDRLSRITVHEDHTVDLIYDEVEYYSVQPDARYKMHMGITEEVSVLMPGEEQMSSSMPYYYPVSLEPVEVYEDDEIEEADIIAEPLYEDDNSKEYQIAMLFQNILDEYGTGLTFSEYYTGEDIWGNLLSDDDLYCIYAEGVGEGVFELGAYINMETGNVRLDPDTMVEDYSEVPMALKLW